MSDTETSPVPAPFDEVPVADTEPGTEANQPTPVASGTWLRLALIALFVGAIGFGQGLGLTLLFDREPEGLSSADEKTVEKISGGHHGESELGVGADAGAERPAGEPEEKEARSDAPPERSPHELVVARERFGMGDVEWARRTSAAFLLRMDGLGHEDTSRSSEAYAMLADVLRHEYERSLHGSQQQVLPEAGSKGDQ